MFKRLLTRVMLLVCGSMAIPALAQQGEQDLQCTFVDQPVVKGDIFINYGSVTDAYSVRNRSNVSVGEPAISNGVLSPKNVGQFGYWSRFYVPPIGPIVKASQGELLDRIQISWQPNPLGSQATDGFKLYRDSTYLAFVDSKTRNYNDFNVIAGRAYTYEVRGVNAYGEGSPGKAVGFQTPNGTVTGWVQTPSGNPVPDAIVALTPLQGFSARFGPADGAFAYSNKGVADTLIPLNNGEWTLSFWVKTTQADADAGIISLHPFPIYMRPMASAGGNEGIEVAQTATSTALLSGEFPAAKKNDWNHVAFTMDDNDNGRLYINGALVGLSPVPPVESAAELRIGARTEAPGTWAGCLDELRLYHRRLDELDFGEVMMGTASSQTPNLKYYWKMDEQLGTGSFDVLKRNKLYFCGAVFDTTRPMVRTMGKTNQQGYYRIESASYGTGTTFLAEPMKDFYMYRALKFTRDSQHYAVLPDFSLTPKATLEMWVNSAGPDNDDQCLLSKTWPGNEFRLLLRQNGINNHIWFYLNGQEHDFGPLGMSYQHLAFAIDSLSGTVTAYKNGIALGSHTFTGVTGNWSDPNSSWLLGARPSGVGTTDHYGGLIDEVALYDTTLSAARILDHAQNGRDMTARGLRVYFSLDEGSGKRLNNSGSVLLPFGTNEGAEWTPFAARQKTEPHKFTPVTRQVTLNPSVTSVDQVDFIDRSLIPVSGYVRYKNTDCFAKNVEILVDSLPYSPRIFTDANGKFVVDFDPGKTATLTPVFEDHEFVPAFWEVTNVVNPIAGILFNDVTTRKVQGVVAGGLCKKSVIKPPPGTGQGTVCRVEVRSTDECLIRSITIDNQEGNYLFEELPPLEALTVSVAEHSEPDIKAAFQTQGGSTVNLSKRDTIIDFIYFAPPQVALNSGLEPLPNCSPPVIVLDQGENIQLSISLIEQYVPILDNMNQVVDDGVCPLDTADFEIINGFADMTLDTAMSNKVLIYKFKVGGPNTSPPYLKTLQIIGTSLAGRKGSLVKQAIVTGEKQKLPSFTTKLPEKPIHVLHDPPGDGSYAFLEKDSSICYTTGVSLASDNSSGNENTFNTIPTLTTDCCELVPGITIGTEIKTINGGTYKFLKSYSRLTDTTFQTCLQSTQRISTDDGDLIVGARGGADVFMGVAQNIIFSRIDKVLFDFALCTARLEESVAVTPGDFATTFIYSEFNIKNYVIPNLGLLLNDPTVTPADSADYEKSIADWQRFLDENNARKEAAKERSPVRNISFDAGASYEYSETIEVTQTSNVQFDTISAEEVGSALGFFVSDAGDQNTIIFSTSSSYGSSKGTEAQNSLTTGYVLKDDDPGDFFSVDVGIDKDYNTPIFNLRAGQSACPWEPGTANREEPNLALDKGSQFKAINVPANEPAVFNLVLGNGSASSETWTYGFTAIPANNPHGAVIKLNGQPLNNNTIQFIVPWGSSIPITLTIERGPVAYEYDSLLVAQVSECELARNYALSLALTGDPAEPKFFSPLYLGVDFIRPCSEVDINVPEQNWVVINNDPNQPGTIRRITASGYNLSNPDFQLVRVQYRRSDGNGAWINLPTPGGIFEAFNPNWSGFYDTQTKTFRTPGPDTLLLGPSFTQFFWETDGLGDGLYEIHAWAVCTGDASGKPGFSEIIKGRIDREPPSIVGVPQPSDGVYHVGDEISFAFNQHINCDKLIPADITQLNNVGLYDATTDQLIDISVTCFENKIVLDPNFDNKFYENRILRAELHGIQDLVGNVFNGTKFNKGIWEFYVDRNELAWLTDSLGLTKFEDENKTATAHIHNRGGYPAPFKILGVPDWVHVSPNQGTLAPNEIRPISFSVDSTLAFGHWRDTIILETQTGQNPFFMGGSEPLPLGVRVVCRPPYGPINLAQYENTMNMVLRVKVEGVFSTDAEDIVAAFIDDQLRGRANVRFVPQTGTWLAYLTIHGDPGDMLKPIRLEVWDASECQRYGSVQEAFTFQPDNVIGLPDVPQVIHTGGLLLREVPIVYGWNWLSFNLAFPDNSLNAALASLKHPQNDLLRSQTAFATHSGGTWLGSLASLGNTGMYIYRADLPDTLRMQGTPLDPAATPIPVAAGWNWIGYVPDYSLPINAALSSLPAQYGDVIKSQYAFAQYFNPTFGWVGNLKYLSPPNGYQIKLAQAGTLTYPPRPNLKEEDAVLARGETETVPAHWTVEPTRFEHSNTLIGMLRANGANATTSNMELGAFAGNEVRGTAQAIYIEPLDAHLFFLTTYANTPGELLRFKLYDDATETVHDLTETMVFAPNQHQGSIENPVPFEWLTSRAEEGFGTTLAFDVQPNPFAGETTLRFNLPKAEEVMLTISDAQGREVVRRPISAVAGENVAVWNGRSDTGSWLAAGVYSVRLQTEAGSVVRKVVLQRLP